MLIPFLSVTAIGLYAGLRPPTGAPGGLAVAGAGLTGAWIGFLFGGAVGVVVDWVLFGGFWPFLLGHLAAFGVARLAVQNRSGAAVPS